MTPSLPVSALTAVISALLSPPFDAQSIERPAAVPQRDRQAIGSACPLCAAKIKPHGVRWARVVPLIHGGPVRMEDAFFSCCRSCALARGAADLHELSAPLELLMMRDRLIGEAPQHLTPRLSAPAIRKVLTARATKSRAAYVAAQDADGSVVLGFSKASAGAAVRAETTARMKFSVGAPLEWLTDHAAAWRVPSAQALNFLWDLIEENALIRRVGHRYPLRSDDWRTCWPLQVVGITAQLERRDPVSGWPILAPTPVRSGKPSSVARAARRSSARVRSERADVLTAAWDRYRSCDPVQRFSGLGDLIELGVMPKA